MRTQARIQAFVAGMTTFALCFGAASVRAQTTAPRQMDFQAVDADTGTAIAGVRVRSWIPEPAETDAQGHCEITLPESKQGHFSYRILLSKAGYVPRYVT